MGPPYSGRKQLYRIQQKGVAVSQTACICPKPARDHELCRSGRPRRRYESQLYLGHRESRFRRGDRTEWAAKRRSFHDECGERRPIFLSKAARARLDIWRRVAFEESKTRRLGHKALPRDETRFRYKGQKDPRELHMW
nr:hypothetical protein CFP56_16815 [Quercus suber]